MKKATKHNILEFMKETDVSVVIAVFYLQEANNNLKKAIENYRSTTGSSLC